MLTTRSSTSEIQSNSSSVCYEKEMRPTKICLLTGEGIIMDEKKKSATLLLSCSETLFYFLSPVFMDLDKACTLGDSPAEVKF